VKLQQVSPFQILEYIKTSIEILMNMKMEDAAARKKGDKKEVDTERSVASNANEENFHADYDKMLVKYEASVRNHIKIEQ
jgi:hypothetical protein